MKNEKQSQNLLLKVDQRSTFRNTFLRLAMMEDASVGDIDLTLRDAQVCFEELKVLHSCLNEPKTNDDDAQVCCAERDLRSRLKLQNEDDLQRRIEFRMATLLRQMMSDSYTVLDQCYYYLYCHFQNNGKLSFHKDLFNIKTPVKQELKYSEHAGQDSAVSVKRNKFVNDQCKQIFGTYCFNEEQEQRDLRAFQENLLKLQAITEVDAAGRPLYICLDHGDPCPEGPQSPRRSARKLVRVKEITHASSEPKLFNPATVTFEELKSVQQIDSWSDTEIFNLLYYFRNFTTHRALRNCTPNLKTSELKGKRCTWIPVPEINNLKQEKREAPSRFHQLPLLEVCDKILSFVKEQRSLLLKVAKYDQQPNTVTSFCWNGRLLFKSDDKEIGDCNFCKNDN